MKRSSKDEALDAVLLLHMLDKAKPIDGKTKLQKVPFFVELKLQEKGLRGPHFRFVRYTYGPFSKDVCDTFDWLAGHGFVTKSSFELTERGRFLVELIVPPLAEIGENAPVFRAMNETLDTCARKLGRTLKAQAYSIAFSRDGEPPTKLRDLPMLTDLIEPSAGGIAVPDELQDLIGQELGLTDSQLEQARRRLPETEKDALARISEAMNAGLPS